MAGWSDFAICYQGLLLKNATTQRSFTTRFAGGYNVSLWYH